MYRARIAAESLLSQQPPSQINDSIASLLLDGEVGSLSSMNSVARSDGAAVGVRINGRMSAVRRCFCLFVLFDVLITIFIWLIIIMLTKNGDLIDCLTKEIIHYKFVSSLFDIVMAAVCRFTTLLLFYGVLHLNTTFFVALSTAFTCIFLILKVIFFKWNEASQTEVVVPFLLISFVLTWSEAWFFDFRVLPTESYANEDQIHRARTRERVLNTVQINADSEGASVFHSPLPNDYSDSEDGDNEVRNWVLVAEKTVNQVYSILIDDASKWRLQKQESYASVYTRTLPEHGVVYYLKFSIKLPLLDVKKELFDNVSQMPCWNASIIISERIQLLADACDIVYQVSTKSVVAAERDMVLVRKCVMKEKCTIIACTSIRHPAKPEQQKYIRVQCGPSGWVLRQSDDNPHVTIANFLMSTDLKLMLPQIALVVPVTHSLLAVAAGLQKRAEILFNQ